VYDRGFDVTRAGHKPCILVFEDAVLGCRRSTPDENGVDLLFGSNFYGIVKGRHPLLLQGFRHNNAIWPLN
jgi:hypothetical protein